MEYERIHKVQTGMISPSKLRMKLMGPHHQKKKDGSNCNSSRTSPSKIADNELFKNSLLATNSADFDEEVSSSAVSYLTIASNAKPDAAEDENSSSHQPEAAKVQVSKSDSVNSSSVHPLRFIDDENLDYDSNASSSSFEFHKGEKSLHSQLTRSLSRNIPSKWNDAEKWITNRQNVHANYSKKVNFHNNHQVNRLAVANMGRVVPESSSYDPKMSVKRVDLCNPPSQLNLENFSFVPSGTNPGPGIGHRDNAGNDLCAEVESKDLMETSTQDTTGLPAIRSVCMRDMGTEMTPIPSQEPSRTATPEGATTPLRSPTSSIPSTPRGGAPAANPSGHTTNEGGSLNSKKELSEQDVKLKTRREIMALGVQLGKMNIAAWASKDEKEKNCMVAEALQAAKLEQIENEKRATAWEEAEKSKHAARYKREEIKIQAWESRMKAKFEAEMRRLEAQVQQMRAHAQAKMVKKISMARQKSEEKRMAAEIRKNQDAEKTATQAEQIRQTGRLPSSPFICCGWLS